MTMAKTPAVDPDLDPVPWRDSRVSLEKTSDASTSDPSTKGQPRPAHQRFVVTDMVAFRYLEEDPSTVVLDRRRQLEGYECYIVEQWACDRSHPTFVITTYTGDPSHKVIAAVLSVPTDESKWSLRLRIYFKALSQYHARPKDTPFGTLMITNLSAFPSSLTVIPVPDGDVRRNRESFFVNENLKRLGCSGRVGITLAPPSGATETKFYQLYRISEKIPLASAVIELVKLCQVALVLFGKLEPEYADGLLCDITEKAINDWWVGIGNEYFSIEPHDGILGPTTVAALLGTLMGARNRLNAWGAPVSKDVFDVENTKRGIAYFQKAQRIPKTRRLDRKTLSHLHRATAKSASGEGWTVPRAVKSTVAELSGKGGEMVMDIVTGRDKAGIAEIETVDIERFSQLVYGERAKWLWLGKPRKHHGNMFSRLPDEDPKQSLATEDDQEQKELDSDAGALKRRETATLADKHGADDKESRIRRATGKLGDARSGIGGRIKDVVGRRGHQHKHSRVDNDNFPYLARGHSEDFLRQSSQVDGQTPSESTPRESLDLPSASEDVTAEKPRKPMPQFARVLSQTPLESQPSLFHSKEDLPAGDEQPELDAPLVNENLILSRAETVENSIAGSFYRGIDLDELFEENRRYDPGRLLHRTNSLSDFVTHREYERHGDQRWPRHLSLSIAEESLFRWRSIVYDDQEDTPAMPDPKKQLVHEQLYSEEARHNGEQLAQIGNVVKTWVEERINHVQELNVMAERDQQELEEVYYPRLEEYQRLNKDAKALIAQEREGLQEQIKDIETLGAKLEYEMNALRGKVEDVGDAVTEFERQVLVVEDMVQMLEDQCKSNEGWLKWLCRTLVRQSTPTAEKVQQRVKFIRADLDHKIRSVGENYCCIGQKLSILKLPGAVASFQFTVKNNGQTFHTAGRMRAARTQATLWLHALGLD